MTFQASINYDYGFGIPGEVVRDGPLRAHTGYIVSGSATNNVFGRMFTRNTDNTVAAGGSGILWGILANPKQHVSFGTTVGPLAPSFTLPNNITADFVEFGKICVQVLAAALPGNQVIYRITDGVLDSVVPTATFTGAIATAVLTVTALTAGTLGIGSIVRDPATGNIIGKIIALGSGTGGNGTYEIDSAATISAEPMVANSVPKTGFLFANATVEDYPQPNANNLALIKIDL